MWPIKHVLSYPGDDGVLGLLKWTSICPSIQLEQMCPCTCMGSCMIGMMIYYTALKIPLSKFKAQQSLVHDITSALCWITTAHQPAINDQPDIPTSRLLRLNYSGLICPDTLQLKSCQSDKPAHHFSPCTFGPLSLPNNPSEPQQTL